MSIIERSNFIITDNKGNSITNIEDNISWLDRAFNFVLGRSSERVVTCSDGYIVRDSKHMKPLEQFIAYVETTENLRAYDGETEKTEFNLGDLPSPIDMVCRSAAQERGH